MDGFLVGFDVGLDVGSLEIAVQELEAATETFPSAQIEQIFAASALYLPALQSPEQAAEVIPVLAPYWPAAHAEHAADAATEN